MKQRKRVKRRGKVGRLQASAGGRKRPAGPTPEWLGYYRPIKKAVTLRLDADALAWCRRQGRGYQTRSNLVAGTGAGGVLIDDDFDFLGGGAVASRTASRVILCR